MRIRDSLESVGAISVDRVCLSNGSVAQQTPPQTPPRLVSRCGAHAQRGAFSGRTSAPANLEGGDLLVEAQFASPAIRKAKPTFGSPSPGPVSRNRLQAMERTGSRGGVWGGVCSRPVLFALSRSLRTPLSPYGATAAAASGLASVAPTTRLMHIVCTESPKHPVSCAVGQIQFATACVRVAHQRRTYAVEKHFASPVTTWRREGCLYPVVRNRYPTPGSVTIRRGWPGSGSSLRRR